MTDLLSTIVDAREQFLALAAEVRPELHRYCTRMTGSVFDGEDVVQTTLAKALFALAEQESTPPLRPWLFRIAHNTAMDFLRRYEHRHVEATAEIESIADDSGGGGDEVPDGERVEAALAVFAGLPPLQRSAFALKAVLGLSLVVTAATMGISIAAVKAALVRARANVAAATQAVAPAPAAPIDLTRLRRYADLFNARDWDALRALFGEETRLDLVSRHERRGRAAAVYFTQYAVSAPSEDLRAEPGLLDGIAVIAMFRPAASPTPAYFLRLEWFADQITLVRDYRYVPYIAADAVFTPSR